MALSTTEALLSTTEAHKRIGVSRATFYRMVKEFAIRRVLVESPSWSKKNPGERAQPLVRYRAEDIDALWKAFNDPKSRRRSA